MSYPCTGVLSARTADTLDAIFWWSKRNLPAHVGQINPAALDGRHFPDAPLARAFSVWNGRFFFVDLMLRPRLNRGDLEVRSHARHTLAQQPDSCLLTRAAARRQIQRQGLVGDQREMRLEVRR